MKRIYDPTEIKLEEGAYIIPTHRCNRSCPFCADQYRNLKGNDMTLETIQGVIPYLLYYGTKRVTIVGGEPLLSKSIQEIVKLLHQSFKVVLTTNGSCPNIIRQLDPHVDHWNFSMYDDDKPPFLPSQLQGDITLTKLIHQKSLSKREELDCYISKYQELGYALKFSTLANVNQWCSDNRIVDYLDSLSPIETAFNGIVYGQWYRDCFIDRKDISPGYKHQSKSSLKVMPSGRIGHTWEENPK